MKIIRIILTLLLLAFLCQPVAASDTETEAKAYSAHEFGTDSILDALPESALEMLPDADIFSYDGVREGFGASYFFETLKSVFFSALSPALKILSQTLALVLAASVLSALKGVFHSDSLVVLFEFAAGLCIMLSVYNIAVEVVESVQTYLTQLSSAVRAMVPVMIGIGTAGGNVGAATVAANAMMLSLAFIETLAADGLFPILQLCFGLAVASGISGELKLDGISKCVRGVFSWLIAFIGAAISAMMTFQSSIASRADSLSMRAMRFVASSGVPVVGSIASDAVGTVASSLLLIKGTVGWVGVIIITLMTLPVILNILLVRLGIRISETAAGVIGLEKERCILSEAGGMFGFLAAVCVIAAIMFIYALALFANSATALS